MIYFLQLIFFCDNILAIHLSFNEINAATPEEKQRKEFVELLATDLCPDPNSKNKVKINDYYAMFVDPYDDEYEAATINIFIDLHDFEVDCEKRYITIGNSAINPDIDFTSSRVYHYKFLKFPHLNKEHDNIPNGNTVPIGLLLVHSTDRQTVLNYFKLSREKPLAVLNTDMITFLNQNLVDMHVYGKVFPEPICNIFGMLHPSFSDVSLYMSREADKVGHADHSISRCSPQWVNCNFMIHDFFISRITPNDHNDCTGDRFTSANIEIEHELVDEANDVNENDNEASDSPAIDVQQSCLPPRTLHPAANQNIDLTEKRDELAKTAAIKRSQVEASCRSSKLPVKRRKCTNGKSDNANLRTQTPLCFMNNTEWNFTECGLKSSGDANLIRLSDIMDISVCSIHHHADAHSLGDLLLYRGGLINYETEFMNLENVFICEKHNQEYSVHWAKGFIQKTQRRGQILDRCMFPANVDGFATHLKPVVAGRYYITKEHVKLLFKEKYLFLPLGAPLCYRHYQALQNAVHAKREEQKPEDSYMQLRPRDRMNSPIIDEPMDCENAGCDNDEDEQPDNNVNDGSTVEERSRENREFVLTMIKEVAERFHVTQPCATEHFSSLAPSTQKRRARSLRSLVHVFAEVLAPSHGKALEQLVFAPFYNTYWSGFEGNTLHEILTDTAENYLASNTKLEKMYSLASVALRVIHEHLTHYLPGLAYREYKDARSFARAIKETAPEQSAIHRIRYEEQQVISFVNFITSPHIVVDLPFGSTTAKKSSGEKVLLPNVMRTMIAERIVEQYLQFLEERNETHLNMSRSSLLRILNSCSASTRHMVQGLDYYTADALDGFDTLAKTVNQMAIKDTSKRDWSKAIEHQLVEGKSYLRSDFRLHLKPNSRIPDHCINFALSNPRDPQLKQNCENHEHGVGSDWICQRCESIKVTLNDILTEIATLPNSAEATLTKYNAEQAVEYVQNWKRHLLRSVQQDKSRVDIMQSLKENEVALVLDWAQKFTPIKGREKQSEYFGKRGLGWHLTVAYRHNETTDDYLMRTYAHVFDHVVQSSADVVAILINVLQNIKSECPEIDSAYLRSDNAGCYHSAHTIGAIEYISAVTAIKIQRYDFVEAQTGKGPCDREASRIKRRVRAYADENHDCMTAEQFIECAASHGGLPGVSMIQTKPITHFVPPEIKFEQITKFANFRFDQHEIRVHEAYEIGVGKSYRYFNAFNDRNQKKIEVLKIYHAGDLASTFASGDSNWFMLGQLYKDSVPETQDDQTDDQNLSEDESEETAPSDPIYKLYHCPINNCIKKFHRYKNLLRHLEAGRHIFKPERISLTDIAIDLYSKTLEKTFTSSRFPELDKTAQPVFYDPKLHATAHILGWALKPPRTCSRFTLKQRTFLIEKFESGVSGQKADYRQTALEMQDPSKGFSPAEFLNGRQIQAFWSRLAKQSSNNAGTGDTQLNQPSNEASRRKGRPPNNSLNRDTRDIKDSTVIDEDVGEEICELEPSDYDILDIDPELYIMNVLRSSDCFE